MAVWISSSHNARRPGRRKPPLGFRCLPICSPLFRVRTYGCPEEGVAGCPGRSSHYAQAPPRHALLLKCGPGHRSCPGVFGVLRLRVAFERSFTRTREQPQPSFFRWSVRMAPLSASRTASRSAPLVGPRRAMGPGRRLSGGRAPVCSLLPLPANRVRPAYARRLAACRLPNDQRPGPAVPLTWPFIASPLWRPCPRQDSNLRHRLEESDGDRDPG
jgi:hypothetical protein